MNIRLTLFIATLYNQEDNQEAHEEVLSRDGYFKTPQLKQLRTTLKTQIISGTM